MKDTKLQKNVRTCNICGYPEPPRHVDEKDETIYCLGHPSIDPFLWNLSPRSDAQNNPVPHYGDYKKYLDKKYVACHAEQRIPSGSFGLFNTQKGGK